MEILIAAAFPVLFLVSLAWLAWYDSRCSEKALKQRRIMRRAVYAATDFGSRMYRELEGDLEEVEHSEHKRAIFWRRNPRDLYTKRLNEVVDLYIEGRGK